MMSSDKVAEICCASCGIAEVDIATKLLKKCGACGLVRYCSIKCQKDHRSQHKLACKKRVAELRDELLFKQPESSHLGDCPICLLPIPLATAQHAQRHAKQSCCSKIVCDGCINANSLRECNENLKPTCPFCRTPVPSTDAEAILNQMKRVEAYDPVAIHAAGMRRYHTGDYETAIEYWAKAAGLGHIESHYHLAAAYQEGRGVEQDMKKFIHHLDQAVIGGHTFARHSLGCWEEMKGNIDRAVKHFIIAANIGCDRSIEKLKSCYARGAVNKEDFAAVLRAHQAAVDATKSPQREAAEAAQKR
jgi:tetratricopeptide (TPR) repeat protein